MEVWADRQRPDDRDINLVKLEEIAPSTYDPDARLKAMDKDDIVAAMLYPNYSRIFIMGHLGQENTRDQELSRACIEAYNDFIGEWCSTNPKRLVAIGIVPMDSVEIAMAELKRMAKKGIRGALIPPKPGAGKFWNDPAYDVLWDTFDSNGMSINMHTGGGAAFILPSSYHSKDNEGGARGGREITATLSRMSNSIPITTLIWSGIFDRHPNLKLVSVESDIGWMAYVKQRMDWVYKNFEWRWHNKPSVKNPPSHYFGRNLMATFQEDIAGIQGHHLIGVEALAWASDFPHPETTYPNTKKFLADQFEGVPQEDVQKIVAGNAARFYNLDLN
jgi:predicted TIM-barrel fold metal-dependent hydrolase